MSNFSMHSRFLYFQNICLYFVNLKIHNAIPSILVSSQDVFISARCKQHQGLHCNLEVFAFPCATSAVGTNIFLRRVSTRLEVYCNVRSSLVRELVNVFSTSSVFVDAIDICTNNLKMIFLYFTMGQPLSSLQAFAIDSQDGSVQ